MRSVRWWAALVLVGAGCDYDAMGQGGSSSDGSGTHAGSTSSIDGSTTGGNGGSSTTVVADGTGSSSSGGRSEATEGTTSETGDDPTGEPRPMPRSCREILDMDPTATTGPYSIVRERDGARVEVWCEMQLDDGGWTLVARSAQGMGPFGWGVGRGTVGDEREPYSLDLVELGMPFSEVLLGRRSGFATVVDNAYVVEVPDGFLEDYDDSTTMTTNVRTVMGGCDPSGGPLMLQRIGHTDSTETYFFRDLASYDVHGLRSDGLEMHFDDCAGGGELDEEQGALFVR